MKWRLDMNSKVNFLARAIFGQQLQALSYHKTCFRFILLDFYIRECDRKLVKRGIAISSLFDYV